MIFAHAIVGLMPVADGQISWFWLVGSIIPDLDHLFVLYSHRIFSFKRIVEAMRFEDKYNLRFKTKYLHSIFGSIVFSLPIMFVNIEGGIYFFLGYVLHLAFDLPDSDEKQYLYPLKVKIRGWLPILSKWEIGFTVFLLEPILKIMI